jgi:hypothetical protein
MPVFSNWERGILDHHDFDVHFVNVTCYTAGETHLTTEMGDLHDVE